MSVTEIDVAVEAKLVGLARPMDPATAEHRSVVANSYTVRSRPMFDLALERDAGMWIVSDRATAIHGSGETIPAALNDFRTAAAEHLDVLQRQDSLTAALTAQVEYLRTRLR